jgi:glycosyltransferase involved in cell wall biosynthesis
MKRVLIVAYYFPPQPRAGSLRPSYLAQHLAEFGWEPIVITVAFRSFPAPVAKDVYPVKQLLSTARLSPEDAPVGVSRPRSRVERLVRDAVKSVLYFPDDASSWFLPAVSKGVALGRERPIDVVLSTSPPITGHFVARSIAAKLHVPWVADYRDLWSGPPTEYFDLNLGRFGRALGYPLERRLLRSAAAITTATIAHRQAIFDAFGIADAVVITNACDLDAWRTVPAVEPTEFNLCYAGAIHDGLRTPETLFAAVARLRAAGRPAGVHAKLDFYGSNAQAVVDCAARHGISDAVTTHGEVDHAVAMEAQRRAAVLVWLLQTQGPESLETGNVGSKIFEYIGARRPVLAIGPNDSAGFQLLDSLGIGLCAVDVPGCADALCRLYDDFVAGRIEPAIAADWRPYTPQNMARDFSDILNGVIGSRAPA